jgi:predicted nuclease of predicted toxin-antitoxin system
MLRWLADENLNGDIVRGVLLRRPQVEFARVIDVGLRGVDDPAVLEWAAANDRIVVTHDRTTLPDFAFDHVRKNEPMPGVFVVNDRYPVGKAIEELLLLDECSQQQEWKDTVVYLPL